MKRPKYGKSCVPGRLKLGRGTQRLKYGTSREIRDGWQAYMVRSILTPLFSHSAKHQQRVCIVAAPISGRSTRV